MSEFGSISSDDHSAVGKFGRVTGRGGVEAFLAHSPDGEEVIEKNQRVVVVEYFPPRSVYVSTA